MGIIGAAWQNPCTEGIYIAEKHETKSLSADVILMMPENPSMCQLSFPDQIRLCEHYL